MASNNQNFNISKQCRTCSKETNDLINIDSLKSITDMISLLLYLNIEVTEGISNAVCAKCVAVLQDILNFKQQCITTLKSMQQYIVSNSENLVQNQSTEVNIKVEDIKETIKVEDIKEEENIGDSAEYTNQSDNSFEAKLPSSPKSDHTIEHLENEKPKPKKFECDICYRKFNNKHYLRRHIKQHSVDKSTLFCEECNKLYASINSFCNHKRRFHSSNAIAAIVCTLCGLNVRNIKYHMNTTHTISNLKCKYCDKILKNQESLKGHIKYIHKHRGLESTLCSICGKVYRDLKQHNKTVHSDERRYKCQYCGKTYKRSSQQRKHERIEHLKERPFKCEYCERAFGTKNILVNHIRTHTAERPFICDICSKGFAQKVTLNTHLKLVHGSKSVFWKKLQ